MKKNNFPNNLMLLRKKYHLSQEELGSKINVSKQTISKYEKGLTEPNFYTLINISKFFNCNLDDLVFGKIEINKKNTIDLMLLIENKLDHFLKNEINSLKNEIESLKNDTNALISNYLEGDIQSTPNIKKEEFSEELSPFSNSNNILDLDFYKKTKIIKASNYHNIENHNNFSKLPCIGQVSAGYPLYANEDIERYFYISKEYRKYNEDDYFILKIKGESMNKLYKNGDYVLIRKTCCIDDTQPSVVLVNKEDATVKFVKFDEEYFYLQPYSNSPEFQENISYKKDENTLNIIGTVVGVVFEEE